MTDTDRLKIVVGDEALRAQLLYAAPDDLEVSSGPSEHGFIESLHPLLVNLGVVALPAGVVAGLIAHWIGDVLKARGGGEVTPVGLQRGGRIEMVDLSEDDVERIAQKVVALLKEPPGDDRAD
jgi:hypothetical protein